jgi:hypothetical protein
LPSLDWTLTHTAASRRLLYRPAGRPQYATSTADLKHVK